MIITVPQKKRKSQEKRNGESVGEMGNEKE